MGKKHPKMVKKVCFLQKWYTRTSWDWKIL